MMDERMWALASALDTLCQLLSDLLRKIKICILVVQLVHQNKLCKLFVQLLHKMQIATHCGQNRQTTCQVVKHRSSVMRNFTHILCSKLIFPH